MKLPEELEYSWENAGALRREARETDGIARRLYEAKLEAWRKGRGMWDVAGGGEVPKEAEERMEKVKSKEGVGESPLGRAFARRAYWRHWANEVHATLGLLDYDRQDPDLEEWERKASWDATVRNFERLAEESRAWEGQFGEEVFDVACPRFFIMEAMEKFTRAGEEGDTGDCEATVAYHLMHLYHAAGMAGGKVALALQYEAFSANALGRIEEGRKNEGASKVEDEINHQANAERPTRGKYEVTQEEAARKLNVSLRTVKYWENGRTNQYGYTREKRRSKALFAAFVAGLHRDMSTGENMMEGAGSLHLGNRTGMGVKKGTK